MLEVVEDYEGSNNLFQLGSNALQIALHRVEILETELRAARKQNEYLEGQVEDQKGQHEQLRADVEAWRYAATQKRLTWRGLFGGQGSARDAL